MTAPSLVVVALSPDELRALVREEVRAALTDHLIAPPTTPLVDRRELARLLVVAPVTVTRLTAEGLPCTYVGDSPRYDVEAVRAWLAERGRRGTKAKESSGPIAGVRLLSKAR